MNNYDIKSAILKKMNPQAFNHPLLAQLDAHQERIASNPDIQRIREESRREQRRATMAHIAVAAVIVTPAVWWIWTRMIPALFL